MNPFLAQQYQIVYQVPITPSGEPTGNLLLGASSSTANIMMTDSVIGISTQAKNYDPLKGESILKDPPSTY